MCGVFGLFLTDPDSTTFNDKEWQSLLSLVNQVQKHRGPDEQNFIYDTKQAWGFAHQRLAVLDLSLNGQQPMISHSKKSHIVFNGEIYNYKELQQKLQLSKLRSHSDTEVLVEGLEKKFENILPELDGMFAFGYFDRIDRRLLLAVDVAGKKPLYTYWDGKVFAFASEIKTLLSLPFINKQLNPLALQQYLVYGFTPYPNTIYQYIRKLPAGCYQWVDLKKGPSPIQSYWKLIDYVKEVKIDYGQAKEQLQNLLLSSVKKRLIADVPIGTFLSGGLDSSIISYLAAQSIKPNKIKTYSVSFSSSGIPPQYDESKYARYVAELISSDHQEIHLDYNNLDSEKILTAFGGPFADSSAIPTYYLAQETSKHVKVVLSGDGGDELFGGYKRFNAGLISQSFGNYLNLFLSPINFKTAPHRSKRGFVMRFKARLKESILSQQLAWNSYFDQSDFKKFLDLEINRLYDDVYFFEKETEHLSPGQRILYYNFKTYLFDDLLPKIDRMSMRHGLEVRSPFLDKQLIEFAFSLPSKYKFDFFQTKKILKDTYQDIFGHQFVHRKKMGFALPIEKFINGQDLTKHLLHLKNNPMPLDFKNITRFNSETSNYYQKAYMLLSLSLNLP